MRKKFFMLLVIMLIAILSITLVACGKNDYSGKATITISFDKVYNDLSVNCPEGEVTKDSETKYSVSLKNSLPVDIVLSCPGYENIILSYSTKDLKNNNNISESVSFKKEVYKFYFKLSEVVDNLQLAQTYSDIKLTKNGESYTLESDYPIRQDIELNAGANYETIVLFRQTIKYFGSSGQFENAIPLIEKGNDKVALYLTGGIGNIDLSDARNYDQSQTTTSVAFNTYTLIDKKDYAYKTNEVIREDNNLLKYGLIQKQTLEEGSYCIVEIRNAYSNDNNYNTIEFEYICDESINNISNSDWWVYSNPRIISTRSYVSAGDVIKFNFQGYNYNKYFYHIITDDEISSKRLNLNVRFSKSDFADRQFKLKFVDKKGRDLVYDSITISRYSNYFGDEYDKEYVYNFDSEREYYIDIKNGSQGYTANISEKIFEGIYRASAEGVVEVVIEVEYRQNITIKYHDIINNVDIETRVVQAYDGEVIYIYSPNNYDYKLITNYNMIYFADLYDTEMVVEVVKQFDVNVHVNGYENILLDEEMQYFYGGNDLSLNAKDIVNNNGYGSIRDVPENLAGQTIQFVLRTYQGEAKYSFNIKFPNDLKNLENEVIEVWLEIIDNEW